MHYLHGLLAAVEWPTFITIIVTAMGAVAATLATVRGNVTTHWKATAEAMEKHLAVAREERAELEKDRDRQRQLKHDALNEVAALRAKTDLEPIIRMVAEVQSELVAQRQHDQENGHQLNAMLSEMRGAINELTEAVRQLLDSR